MINKGVEDAWMFNTKFLIDAVFTGNFDFGFELRQSFCFFPDAAKCFTDQTCKENVQTLAVLHTVFVNKHSCDYGLFQILCFGFGSGYLGPSVVLNKLVLCVQGFRPENRA